MEAVELSRHPSDRTTHAERESDEVQAIRRGLRERVLHVAMDVENGHTGNIDFELESIIHFVTELSYHIDVTDILAMMKEAFDLLVSADQSLCLSQKPNLVYLKKKGRPSYAIPKETLSYFIENKFTIKQMAELMSVSEKTVANKMQEYGLSIRQTYSRMSDDQLDSIVKEKVTKFPTVGYRTIKAHLLSDGVHVTDRRIQKSMRRVDPLGVMLRNLYMRTYRIKRRQYNVKAPMSLWHVDTNHKLIRWRFIFHGGIDGFSRMPMYMIVASDNKADTALKGFLRGVREYGLPQRVRTDKGMENIKIAEFMLTARGLNSHLTGRSVHNQRIERFWRELWQGCTNTFYNLFWSMEHEGILDADNEIHILALHLVFVPRIQMCIDNFCAAVSRRPLRTEHQKTPIQLWIMGQFLDPAVQLTSPEIESYGIDFNGPVDTSPDADIVVPPLCEVDESLLNELKAITSRYVDDPYDFQAYVDVCSHLIE